MARRAKSWYWKARKIWCVYHNGEKIPLGPDREAAFIQYHEIMAKPVEKHHPIDRGCIAAMLDDFLTWTEENRAKKTFTRYRDFIQSFVNEYGSMGILSINASHVTAWLNTLPQWNSTTKRNAITALQRGFNWAVKNRGMEKNPIRGMEKPKAKQYAHRFRQYDFRHCFVTRKFRAGVDSHVVAALIGHKDTKMIETVYSHVADECNFMLEQAQKENK